jgi:hypothetical protein
MRGSVLILLAAGCGLSEAADPTWGRFEVYEVANDKEVVPASSMTEDQFEGCAGARMVWDIQEDRVTVGFDALCPAGDEMLGCEVRVAVRPVWEDGVLRIPHFAASESQIQSAETADRIASCSVEIVKARFEVVRARNRADRIELHDAESGTTYRLRSAAERPPYAAWRRASEAS